MPFRFPPRVSQSAVFRAGTPDYIDVASGVADDSLQTFKSAAAASSAKGDTWAAGEEISIVVSKTNEDRKIWTALWDGTVGNERLVLSVEESSVGSISDGDAVTVFACPTENTLRYTNEIPQRIRAVEVTGDFLLLSTAHMGKTLCFTSATPVSVTIDDTLPLGFHCMVVQEGAGLVSLSPAGSHTLNGGTSGRSLAGQWTSAYLYQRTMGAWVALV